MIVIVFLGVVSRFNMYRIKKNYNDLIKNYDENKDNIKYIVEYFNKQNKIQEDSLSTYMLVILLIFVVFNF